MGLAHNINDGHRTEDIRITQDVTFDSMLLKSDTLEGLRDSGFYKPSPIQLHAIPLGKCGFDLLLEAKSGTGKTAVFSVIALEKIDISKGLQVIILAPTREIAMQICDVIKQIGSRHHGLQVEVVMGGLPLIDDIEKFKKNVHIVVGSPGRLKHLIQDKIINISTVRMFILDEADKLMEKSFQADINYIHLSLPQQKQVIMSSATYPESSKSFIKSYVQNAQHVCPDNNNILLGIDQRVTIVKHNSNIVKKTQHKFIELLKILTNNQFKQCLIFCNYQARICELHKMLSREKWPAEQLFGQQEQTDRLDALKTLQEYKCRILISTDLAARGIDASNVDLVINFEPPYEWQTYLHRIGRAGRFGSYGTAITILSEGVEQNKFKTLLESIKFSFNLTYLWSNAQFSVNTDDNVNEQCSSEGYDIHTLNQKNMSNPTLKDNYKKLWIALTSDIKMKKPLETFDNLCKSFNEPDRHSTDEEKNDHIEVFSDLLQSFHNSQEAKENNELLQIELFEMPLNGSDFLNSEWCKILSNNDLKLLANAEQGDIIKNKEQSTGKQNFNPFPELNLNAEEIMDSGNTINVVNKIKNHIRIKDKNFGDGSELLLNINNNNNLDDCHNQRAEIYGTNIKNETEDICKTLVDYGLPTSFSSSKPSFNMQNKINSHSSKSINSYNNYTSNNSPNLLHCKTIVEQKCQEKNNKHKKSKKIKRKIKTEYDMNSKICDKQNPAVELQEKQRQCTLQSNSKISNMVKENPSSIYLCKEQKTHTKEHEKQNYINWYHALKLRVKQIETIMYVNEISKL